MASRNNLYSWGLSREDENWHALKGGWQVAGLLKMEEQPGDERPGTFTGTAPRQANELLDHLHQRKCASGTGKGF